LKASAPDVWLYNVGNMHIKQNFDHMFVKMFFTLWEKLICDIHSVLSEVFILTYFDYCIY